MKESKIMKVLPLSLKKYFVKVEENFEKIRQVRLRVNMPAMVEMEQGEFSLQQ